MSIKELMFLDDRLLSSQPEQLKSFRKASDWLEKSGLSKKATLFLYM